MGASLRNHIRSVEPQRRLQRVLTVPLAGCLSHKVAAEACTSPVPPNIQKQIAMLIRRSRIYQDTVQVCNRTSEI